MIKPLNDVVVVLNEVTGADVPGVKLIVGLFLSQVFSFLYRVLVSRIPVVQLRKVITLVGGLFIGYFVWDIFMLHHVLSALGFYIIFIFTNRNTTLNFVYQLGFLVLGYYYNNMKADYAINWTTSQAVLTLKMIGVGFDVAGGNTPMPSLLDTLGYTFNIGTYLVGPIDDMNRYNSFINQQLFKSPPPLKLGFIRFLMGIIYMVISQIALVVVPTDFIFTSSFDALPLLARLLYIGAWGHASLYKYLGVWCIAESACMYTGYTYEQETGSWSGLRNMATYRFHLATSLQDIIDTFNINTNKWCFKYIYKRCKGLGNKNVSQLAVLVFLAIWHGLHLGYFTCFFQEFYYMFMENLVKRSATVQAHVKPLIPDPLLKVFLWVYTKVFLSFALVGFELYTYDKITTIYGKLGYFCPVAGLVVIIAVTLINSLSKTKAGKKE